MPGLNQLKQFSEDIRELGDETKIRAQRGERVLPVPLPQGISEEDDSDDFIIGIPEKKGADGAGSSADGGLDSLSGGDSPIDVNNLDPLFGGDIAADDDALADFLSDDTLSAPAEDLPDADSDSDAADAADSLSLEDMDFDSLPDFDDGGAASESAPETVGEINLNEDIPASVLENDGAPPDAPLDAADSEPAPAEGADFSDLNDALSDLGDLGDLNFDDAGSSSEDSGTDGLNPDPIDAGSPAPSEDAADSQDISSILDEPPVSDDVSAEDTSPLPDFGDLDDLGDLGNVSDTGDSPLSSEDGAADGLNLDSFDVDSLLSDDAAPAESSAGDGIPADGDSGQADEPLGSVDFSDTGDMGGLDSEDSLGDLGSFDIDSLLSDDNAAGADEPLSAPDASSPGAAAPSGDDDDISSVLDGVDFDNLGASDSPDAGSEIPDAAADVPSDGTEEFSIDDFDTSSLDGVDFGPQAADSAAGDDFPTTDDGLGGDDEFVLDSSFEIPGFSDTETADIGKKGLDTVDFSQGKEGRPRNSLTDEEYAAFKKNLSNYPLNLRIAVEDFISNDEFTDDAVFEIIEKVLKKTSARQLATQLEKILDISINIPRDFERRSFAEYEAYKQSFQYQLKNRIIPAAIVGVILAFVCFGLFKAGVHFIYKPVMANIHYKQGYTLLEANEFPQSEEEFREAVRYRAVKKWFFKYALGYRERKQYERAAQMYRNILLVFDHDKQAGLDYADMELHDRANYERAEEIVRREVLDYHINDADGLLMLGDVFLEWAEIDDSKYELARQEYLDLIQRYGSDKVYLSRMLRYNIRTDKLREVIYYKNMFYVSKQDKQNLKNLGAADWTELSGYLLEKLYGRLSKNDEYLRSSIEDVLAMLNLAVKADPSNPVARYNLARYFIQNGNTEQARTELETSISLFDAASVRTKKNVYREINATRVLGELYADGREYLKAQTVYTRGINLYNEEHENSGLEGDENTGRLFADLGDLDYFISGDLEDALYNYEKAIEIKSDTPSINFRVGSIYYGQKNYDNALASFIKVAEKEPRNPNMLLSLGNVLSLRGDNFAAESYYSDLLKILDSGRDASRYLLPQEDADDFETVDLYLKANNNLGVTLFRIARQTGNSAKNAEAIVRLSDSMRAWDALTRNPETMVRMEGSNLAAQNSKYITHPYPDFEPAIYTDIPRVLSGEKGLE